MEGIIVAVGVRWERWKVERGGRAFRKCDAATLTTRLHVRTTNSIQEFHHQVRTHSWNEYTNWRTFYEGVP